MHAVHMALLLVGQLLDCSPVLLALGVHVVDGLVEEDLGDLWAALLSAKTNVLAPCEYGQYLGRTLKG